MDGVLRVESCALAPAGANVVLRLARALCEEAGLRPADAPGGGLLRALVIRRGDAQPTALVGAPKVAAPPLDPAGEYLVNIVTVGDGRRALAPLAEALVAAAAAAGVAVAGVVNSVASPKRPHGERRVAAEHCLAGKPVLVARLGDLDFEVSANSFFQVSAASPLIEPLEEGKYKSKTQPTYHSPFHRSRLV
jgi:tRNA/tmRNA/rRNA uracil-C5-methylase (TrmA/RlmC/RlmD family)